MRGVFQIVALVLVSGLCEGINAQASKVASSNAGCQLWEIPFASKDNTITLSLLLQDKCG